MINKKLQLLYVKDGVLENQIFSSFKRIHIFLYENGVPEELQINDLEGNVLLHYINKEKGCTLNYKMSVPGSLIFEIINQREGAPIKED